MRKNHFYTLSAALMTLIAAPIPANAFLTHQSKPALTAPAASPAKEDAGVILLGYVNPQETVYPYTGFSNNTSDDLTAEFAIRLRADMLAQYAGAKITGIHVGWGEGPESFSPEMTSFLRSDINGENIASGSATAEFGWNDVYYDTPYTITGDTDLFVGAVVPFLPKVSWIPTGLWGGDALDSDIQYFGAQEIRGDDGNIIWENPTSSEMKILILAIVEAAGDEYEDMMSLTTLRLNDVQSLDNEGEARVIIRNDGINAITDFDVKVECGDRSWTTTVDLPEDGLDPITTGTLNIPFQALASGVHRIWVSKVNGTEVKEPDVHEVQILAVSDETASSFPRRPLVERWISESNHYTAPFTDQIFVPGIEEYRDKVSVVAHHFDDQFMQYHYFDEEVQCEDLQFLVDFVDGNKMKVFVPCMTVDRSFHTYNQAVKADEAGVCYNFVYPMFVGDIYEQALATPSFASVKANAELKDGICEVTVEGDIASGVLPEGENLFLTVYLLENGIVSTSQEFPDDPDIQATYQGKYTHNDLIRHQFTPMYGDGLDASGNYKKVYEVEFDEEWKVDNMRILAFLNRGKENGNFSRQVINTTENGVKTAGIGGVTLPDGISIRVVGRDIVAEGDFETCEVFAANGARVGSRSLTPGIYVVKTSGSKGSYSVKVLVK